ncbi:hypothetical protein EYF80_003036 [Liparis tanakae]|uniref:Uncharacterized protein n=1 Tax=Liparis tanakae TaxID=230148 RepID=A0A4Z2JAT2_9TELE|nr:hypothetical protein EYF80_003036 [Liparis tanakae]
MDGNVHHGARALVVAVFARPGPSHRCQADRGLMRRSKSPRRQEDEGMRKWRVHVTIIIITLVSGVPTIRPFPVATVVLLLRHLPAREQVDPAGPALSDEIRRHIFRTSIGSSQSNNHKIPWRRAMLARLPMSHKGMASAFLGQFSVKQGLPGEIWRVRTMTQQDLPMSCQPPCLWRMKEKTQGIGGGATDRMETRTSWGLMILPAKEAKAVVNWLIRGGAGYG